MSLLCVLMSLLPLLLQHQCLSMMILPQQLGQSHRIIKQMLPSLPPLSVIDHLTLSLKDPSSTPQDHHSPTRAATTPASAPAHDPYPARIAVKRIDLQTLDKASVAQLVTSLLKDVDIQVPSHRPTANSSPRHHARAGDHSSSAANLSVSGRTAHGISTPNESHAGQSQSPPLPPFTPVSHIVSHLSLASRVSRSDGGGLSDPSLRSI